METIQCLHCQTQLRKHQFSFALEEWETEPTFYPMDSNEAISYCLGCGKLLALGEYEEETEKNILDWQAQEEYLYVGGLENA